MPSIERSWTIRAATRADAPAIRDLFSEVFGLTRPESHDAWKFDANPCGPPIALVAVDGTRIIAQHALWPSRLRVGAEVVSAAQALDTMTHRDYRGQGLFTALATEAGEVAAGRGIEVLYAFPNDASYPGFVRKLDWDHTGNIDRFIRPLRPSQYRQVPGWLGNAADTLARALPTGRAGDLAATPPTADELAELATRVRGPRASVEVERDAGHLKWRFLPDSGMDYRWVTSRDPSGALRAVAVWGTELQGSRARLAEWLAADPDAGSVVLAHAVRGAAASGHDELTAIGRRPGMRRALHRSGFIRRGGLPLVVRKLTGRAMPGNVHNHDGWSVFGADLDTF